MHYRWEDFHLPISLLKHGKQLNEETKIVLKAVSTPLIFLCLRGSCGLQLSKQILWADEQYRKPPKINLNKRTSICQSRKQQAYSRNHKCCALSVSYMHLNIKEVLLMHLLNLLKSFSLDQCLLLVTSDLGGGGGISYRIHEPSPLSLSPKITLQAISTSLT